MRHRIKEVREHFGLSQRKFAKRMGVGASTYNQFENGSRNIKDIHIKRIVSEFGVNELWLRTGEGDMLDSVEENDRYTMNIAKLGMTDNEFIINTVNLLAETDPEKLEILQEMMKKMLGL